MKYFRQEAPILLLLAAASLAMLFTAPVGGDFWWQDAPRHAMNGVFLHDLVAAHPFSDPVSWAIKYYVRHPAITLPFYPPFFHAVEACVFTLAGASHFCAQAVVAGFIFVLAVSTYRLGRFVLPRWSAVGLALLLVGAPENAFWGRQVMLDVPAFALATAACACLGIFVQSGRQSALVLAALLFLGSVYTRYESGFVALPMAAALFYARGTSCLRDKTVLAVAGLTLILLLPAIFLFLKFGVLNVQSVVDDSRAYSRFSLENWFYYAQALPGQLGWLPLACALAGLPMLVHRAWRREWFSVLMLTWLLTCYLLFSAVGLKSTRFDIMILLPLALSAALFVQRVGGPRLGTAASGFLGAGQLFYALVALHVPRVEGYHQVADWIAAHAPPSAVVLFNGYRDANLVFDLAVEDHRPDITVLRADKLLLSVPSGERERGLSERNLTQAQIAVLVARVAPDMVVLQPNFWNDLPDIARFEQVIDGGAFKPAAHFPLSGDLSTQDGNQGMVVLMPPSPPAHHDSAVEMNMPMIGRRIGTPPH
jgi:hypothetical protein